MRGLSDAQRAFCEAQRGMSVDETSELAGRLLSHDDIRDLLARIRPDPVAFRDLAMRADAAARARGLWPCK